MATTTRLTKWGNSQGVTIPKHLCKHLGLSVGDTVEIRVDAAARTIVLAQVPLEEASNLE